jgi:hypothetical protein
MRNINNKKAVSEIVAYVILITIALGLATLVFTWLKFQANLPAGEECPDDVAIIIKSAVYNCATNNLDLVLQNKGLFNITGYRVRVSQQTGAEIGEIDLTGTGRTEPIGPGSEINLRFDSSTSPPLPNIPPVLTYLEVQPYVIKDRVKTFCGRVSSQALQCSA